MLLLGQAKAQRDVSQHLRCHLNHRRSARKALWPLPSGPGRPGRIRRQAIYGGGDGVDKAAVIRETACVKPDFAFAGARSGSGPATWGQSAIWDAVRRLGADAARYNVSVG